MTSASVTVAVTPKGEVRLGITPLGLEKGFTVDIDTAGARTVAQQLMTAVRQIRVAQNAQKRRRPPAGPPV